MFDPVDSFDATELQQAAEGKLDVARTVEGTAKSPGWALFMALLRERALDAYAKDYDDLLEYRASRMAIRLMEETVNDFLSMTDTADAEQILTDLEKLTGQTPFSSLLK